MTLETLTESIATLEELAWEWVGVWVILAVSIYLSIRTGAVQFRRIPDMFRTITERAQRDDDGRTRSLSSFQAFAISAAARVGTGNIAGVAGAIAMGGPGAVFWMWVMAAFTASASFVESTLAQLYKVRRFDTFKGGPAYYIHRGLGTRSGGIVFAVIFIFCFALSFTSLQANTIVDAVTSAADAGGMEDTTTLTWVLAVLLTLMTGIIVVKGLRRVASVAQSIVPAMVVFYMVLGLIVVIINIEQLPTVFTTIFSEAFNFRSAAGGAFGAMIMAGIQRGMLSNEAGMGSVPNVAATADVSHPAKQGLVQTLGVYVDTWIVCSVTAFIILVTIPDPSSYAEANPGVELTQTAMESTLGIFGAVALAAVIFLVAFTSVLGNYSYGEANLLFISNSETARRVFALVLTGVVFFGSVIDVDLAWTIAEFTMVIIAVFNLVAITLLSPKVFKLLRDYERQKKQGLDPIFRASDMPELKNVECWTDEDAQGFASQPKAKS